MTHKAASGRTRTSQSSRSGRKVAERVGRVEAKLSASRPYLSGTVLPDSVNHVQWHRGVSRDHIVMLWLDSSFLSTARTPLAFCDAPARNSAVSAKIIFQPALIQWTQERVPDSPLLKDLTALARQTALPEVVRSRMAGLIRLADLFKAHPDKVAISGLGGYALYFLSKTSRRYAVIGVYSSEEEGGEKTYCEWYTRDPESKERRVFPLKSSDSLRAIFSQIQAYIA